ncbi:hypothetical protein L6452_33065 [Arctium lappa]|uniref:Uncharacterized protein n=1 Tax=Arctium lappa TaxID=4217 RepID=A0ACB8Z6Q6_ARCLA|nr:hypothetical protein L6452_33065 [Arctium lappa]
MASSPSSKGEGSKVNEKTVTPSKRPKHNVESKVNEKHDTDRDVSRLNIPQKPNVVTTSSGLRVILPSVRNDDHKKTNVKDKSSISPSKANSEKSKNQVGISKSPVGGKGSKSPMNDNSPMSHVKANSPKQKDRIRVLDYSRKQRTHDRADTYESPASNSEFPCSMTTRSHASKKKELNVTRKAEGGNDIYLTDPAPRAKCVKVAWRKQFLGKKVHITEGKKLDVERRRPTISVWNMENLCRREYLELSDGGFGTWKLIRDNYIQKERPRDVFAERSGIPKISTKSKLKDYKDHIRAKLNEILAQKQIAKITIEKAISDFLADLDLRTLDMEFRSLFNPHDGYTGAQKDQNSDKQFHMPNKITRHHKHQEEQASKDKDQSPITIVGLQLVPGIPLETSQYWNNPRTHIELDDTFNSYGRKKEFKSYEIPKMDLAICDAQMAKKRESKLGESLRSPYVKRTIAIDALETSSEKKICTWINVAIEPICELVFETTTGVVALIGTIESLCLDVEGTNQVKQLQMLRKKYTSKLLLSDINLRRSVVIADCEKFNALDVKERARVLQYAEANRETRLTSI